MKKWIQEYLDEQLRLVRALPADEIEKWIGLLKQARDNGSRIFICGNGGSASNASHFTVDLGKGASGIVAGETASAAADVKRFCVQTLNDNMAWLTALANDCSYEDVFVEQLKNSGRKGDILIGVSVSGNSPNIVKAMEWAKQAGMTTLALVGKRPGNRMSRLAARVIAVDSGHYGKAEDSQMMVLHLLCYAFIEKQA